MEAEQMVWKQIKTELLSLTSHTQQEADAVYEQAMIEMRSADFTALWYLLSV
jgi:hypothetical protein